MRVWVSVQVGVRDSVHVCESVCSVCMHARLCACYECVCEHEYVHV